MAGDTAEMIAPSTRACIVGGPGSGKTAALVERVCGLLGEGADGSDILVLAATPEACAAFERRLAERVGAGSGVRARTARAVELEMLADDEARRITGRRPRLLAMFEANVLVEDLKTGGLRQGRLREMLKFFYRGWSELADDDPAWLYTDEELALHSLLKECLGYTGGVLAPELANLAVRFARQAPGAFGRYRRAHVVVDDYQTLCRASQVLAGMLARTSLVVAGDPLAGAEVFEEYPFAEGLAALVDEPGVEVVRLSGSRLPAGLLAAAEGLSGAAQDCLARARAAEGGEAIDETTPAALSADGGTVAVLACDDPESEVAAVADRVEQAVAAGADPGRIFLATPNRIWSSMLAAELGRRGIATDGAFDPRALNGDVRDLAHCVAARVFTLVALAADPTDDLAWRSWCGFGDWLANSPGMAALRRCRRPLHEVLAELADAGDELPSVADRLCGELAADERHSVSRVVDAYRQGLALVAGLEGLSGSGLVARAYADVAGDPGAVVPGQVLAVFSGGGAQDCAAAMLDGALRRLAEPTFAGTGGAVRVGSIDAVRGLSVELLVVTGFVNGFTPRHSYFDEVATSPSKRLKLFAGEALRLYGALGACSGEMLVTAFTSLDALRAERLNLKIDRYRMRGGVRIAKVSPSVLLG